MNELRINRSLAAISTHVRNLHDGALGNNADLLAIIKVLKRTYEKSIKTVD